MVSSAMAPAFDAAHRATLDSGKPVVFVCPPAAWAVRPFFECVSPTGVPGLQTVILVPEITGALELGRSLRSAATAQPAFAATGLTRTDRLLRRGAVRTLLITPSDAMQLVTRSALKLGEVPRVWVAWPEMMGSETRERQVDTILSEARAAQRLIVTSDDSAIAGFLQRHARRAPVVASSRPPAEPSARPIRYGLVEGLSRPRAARAVLDGLDPQSTVLWAPTPGDDYDDLLACDDVRIADGTAIPDAALVIAGDLPSGEILGNMASAAPAVVVLLRPSQLGYLRRLAGSIKPLQLSTEVDRARDRLMAMRTRLREHLRQAELDTQLLALEPLLEEFDPTLIAAAALTQVTTVEPSPPATWTRLRISAGKREQLRPADVLGVLVNQVGLRPKDVGRIELRESFTLVEVPPEDSARAVQGITGQTIRGHRVSARLAER